MTNWSNIGKASRRKGGTYERKIARILTESTNKSFRRAPRSGALLRDGMINGAYISGDLISEYPTIFSIECKNRKAISIDSLIKNPETSELAISWNQCVYDAELSNKIPLMFFHMLRADFVCLNDQGVNMMKPATIMTSITNITGNFVHEADNKINHRTELPNMHIITIDSFTRCDLNKIFEG